MLRPLTGVAALLLASIAARTPSPRLEQVDAGLERSQDRLARMSTDNRDLVQQVAVVRTDFDAARVAYESASDQWRSVELNGNASIEANLSASQSFDAAASNYRRAALTAIAMAASHQICESKLSTAQYRRLIRHAGGSVEGQDVDHLFPRSLGGVDHPLNYQMLNSSTNRSLGNDLSRKLAQAPLGVMTGMAVSALAMLGGCS